MNFINQIDFIATARWRILHVIQQVAHIIDAGARCCIDLNKVYKSAFIDFSAAGANTTGNRAYALFAVKAFGQNARNGSFTHTTGAGKQIGMVQAVVIQRINQRLKHMLLTCHLGK